MEEILKKSNYITTYGSSWKRLVSVEKELKMEKKRI